MEKLTTYQATVIITDTELRLVNLMKQATELEPSVKEYYDAYITLKDKFDGVKKEIEENKQLLDWASRQKNNIHEGKEFRTIRSESHINMKPREKRKLSSVRIPWTSTAIDILSFCGHFLSFDDMWSTLCHRLELKDVSSKIKHGGMFTVLKQSPKIFVYQEMFGLPEWKDNPGKYLKRVSNAG